MRLSGSEIATATDGIWHGSVPDLMTGVGTDSRSFEAGNAFLALRGPHFDGHGFAASVADKAVALIGDRAGMHHWAELKNSKLEVRDTLQALGDIAHAWRNTLTDTCVIAITGSYGKTSIRSMLECGFSALGFKVVATHANLNNLIGVPRTLLAVPADADIAVIECGISERGEMARLAAMVEPDIAVLTGITAAHTEGLGGLGGVIREKSLLPQAVREGGWCALGEGVAALMQANHIALPKQFLVSTGGEMVDWQLNGCELTLRYQHQQHRQTLALPARHWGENISFAASIMLHFLHLRGCPGKLCDIASALAGWQPMAGRMQRRQGHLGVVVLDDSYNANPVSMQAAIDTLREIAGKKTAILGDMAELGAAAEAAHAGIDIDGVDRVFLIGTQMQKLAEKHPESCWFANTEVALNELASMAFGRDDTVLVKASRSIHLEAVVELLCTGEIAHAV